MIANGKNSIIKHIASRKSKNLLCREIFGELFPTKLLIFIKTGEPIHRITFLLGLGADSQF